MESTQEHAAAATLLTELKSLYCELGPNDREVVRGVLSNLLTLREANASLQTLSPTGRLEKTDGQEIKVDPSEQPRHLHLGSKV
jgi:hypothetical protein